MLRLQNGINVDESDASGVDGGDTNSDEDCVKDLGIQRMLEGLRTSPYVIGDLQVISLGNCHLMLSNVLCGLKNFSICWISSTAAYLHVLIEEIFQFQLY